MDLGGRDPPNRRPHQRATHQSGTQSSIVAKPVQSRNRSSAAPKNTQKENTGHKKENTGRRETTRCFPEGKSPMVSPRRPKPAEAAYLDRSTQYVTHRYRKLQEVFANFLVSGNTRRQFSQRYNFVKLVSTRNYVNFLRSMFSGAFGGEKCIAPFSVGSVLS